MLEILSLLKDILFRQVINDSPNTRGPKAARLQDRIKGRFVRKTVPQKGPMRQVNAKGVCAKKTSEDRPGRDEPPPPEENPDETREYSDEENSSTLTISYIWFYAHHICCQLKAVAMMT